MGSVITTVKGYICVPEGIIQDLDLTSAALWACIYATPEKNPEKPGIKHIAQYTIGQWTGLARQTINRNLPRLIESGYLTCEDERPGLTSGYKITPKISLYAISEAKKTETKFIIGNFIPVFRYLTVNCNISLTEAAVYGAIYRNMNNPIFDRRQITAPEIQGFLHLSNNTVNRAVRKLIYYGMVEEIKKDYDWLKYYTIKENTSNIDENVSNTDENVSDFED